MKPLIVLVASDHADLSARLKTRLDGVMFEAFDSLRPARSFLTSNEAEHRAVVLAIRFPSPENVGEEPNPRNSVVLRWFTERARTVTAFIASPAHIDDLRMRLARKIGYRNTLIATDSDESIRDLATGIGLQLSELAREPLFL